MLRIYFPRVVAKSLEHFKVIHNKSKIQRQNENKLNPDVCFNARIVNNGSSSMSPGFHIKFPQYTATR